MENRISVSYHGRLWALPGNALYEAMADVARDLVAEGENRVVENLTESIYSHGGAHPDRYRVTGHYRRSVNGRMLGSLHGEIHDSKVVYGPWLEGVSARNQTTRFKGYAAFRRARQELERIKVQLLQRRLRRLFE